MLELRVGAGAQPAPSLDVLERIIEAAKLELAQPEHYPRRSDLRTEACRLAEGDSRVGESVSLV